MNEHSDRDRSEHPNFEAMLADPVEQYDPRAEVLASIVDWTNAPSSTMSAASEPHAPGDGQGDPVEPGTSRVDAARETRYAQVIMGRTVTTAVPAVMAVADAEQAELRSTLDLALSTISRMLGGEADVARVLGLTLPDDDEFWADYLADGLIETARARMADLRAAEAKVACVAALVDQWDGEIGAQEDHKSVAAVRAVEACMTDVVAALAGPGPEATEGGA
ncbi:hypothetical protein GCM10009740_31580 [Terrabacter terrae]|uniref:Uncharacterized protein n=1 Tax=Terrabacter terrae TaxID=318434 RepID=A0ABN2UHQ4_9MICO